MIKSIISMPRPEPNERLERLKEDIREIIEKRVPIAEIVDPPYGKNTMRERLGKAIRLVVWEYARNYSDLRVPSSSEVFTVESHKAEDTVTGYRWYVKFDVARWEQCLREPNPQVPIPLTNTGVYNVPEPSNIPEACRNCPNHPVNGGSGICNCVLGMSKVTC